MSCNALVAMTQNIHSLFALNKAWIVTFCIMHTVINLCNFSLQSNKKLLLTRSCFFFYLLPHKVLGICRKCHRSHSYIRSLHIISIINSMKLKSTEVGCPVVAWCSYQASWKCWLKCSRGTETWTDLWIWESFVLK